MISNQPSLREKLCFGFGDLASVLYWQTFMAYLLLFYTDVFGISAAAAGTMIMVSRLLDGVLDPVVGMIADRTETRWGKFRPYLLWFCVPFATLGVLTFTVPNLDSGGKLLWAYVTFMGLMFFYTIINIPYTALLGVISADPHDRTNISSIKFVFAYTAGMIVSASLLPMVRTMGGGDEARGWQLSFVVYGMAAIAFFLVAFAGTRERVRPPPRQTTTISRDLADLFSNRQWVILLLVTLTFILFMATRISATAHYFKYYIGRQTVTLGLIHGTYGYEELVSAFNSVGQGAAIVGVFLVSWLSRKVGKRKAFLVLSAVAIACSGSYYFLSPQQIVLIFLLQILGSVAGGPLSALIWAMYADTADYGEWKTGRRATGLVFSASTMGQKLGWAVGAAAAGWLMAAVGFHANVSQTARTQHGLRLLVSLIPAGFGVSSLLPLLWYQLDEQTMKKVSTELAARRAAAEREEILGQPVAEVEAVTV